MVAIYKTGSDIIFIALPAQGKLLITQHRV